MGHHERPTLVRGIVQHLDCELPCVKVLLRSCSALGQVLDVGGGILKNDELTAVRERDWRCRHLAPRLHA
jgi:hypothetical protein